MGWLILENFPQTRTPTGRKIFPVTEQVQPDAIRIPFLVLFQWEKMESRGRKPLVELQQQTFPFFRLLK